MSEPLKDRPAKLARRIPQPAPDERIDPIEIVTKEAKPSSEGQPSAMSRRSRKREITVPLGTRISLEADQLLSDAVAETGLTIRAVLEEAIISRWKER